MHTGQASRTALRVAAFRAAHQICDGGRIFADPYAVDMVGADMTAVALATADEAGTRGMRFWLAARSRFADDALTAAVDRGVRQLVILGAGLDTFGLRNPYRALGLRVFEVDHPDTQADKRARLARIGQPDPAGVSFVAVDFAADDLAASLWRAGWDPLSPTVFEWLGVSVYLPEPAVCAILTLIGGFDDSELIFDYTEPPHLQAPGRRSYTESVMTRTAADGEPWLSFFSRDNMARQLHASGFTAIDDLDIAALRRRYAAPDNSARDADPGPHIVRARREP